VFNNVGYPPNAFAVTKLMQAKWAKNTTSAENCKVFVGKAEGVGWQNLGWREGTEYIQYSDRYERSNLEEFLGDSSVSEYCPWTECFEGKCSTAIHTNRQISCPA